MSRHRPEAGDEAAGGTHGNVDHIAGFADFFRAIPAVVACGVFREHDGLVGFRPEEVEGDAEVSLSSAVDCCQIPVSSLAPGEDGAFADFAAGQDACLIPYRWHFSHHVEGGVG